MDNIGHRANAMQRYAIHSFLILINVSFHFRFPRIWQFQRVKMPRDTRRKTYLLCLINYVACFHRREREREVEVPSHTDIERFMVPCVVGRLRSERQHLEEVPLHLNTIKCIIIKI